MNPEDYGIGTREIKFRAWVKFKDQSNDKMVYLNESRNTVQIPVPFVHRGGKRTSYRRMEDFWRSKTSVLMQYTGLKDKNGKKIYEGDVISEFGGPGIVCFRNECFVCESIKEPGKFLYNWRKGRVIGNVFENPELMK